MTKERREARRSRVDAQSREIKQGIRHAVETAQIKLENIANGSDGEEGLELPGDELVYPALSSMSRYETWADSEKAAVKLREWLLDEKNPGVVLGLGIVTAATQDKLTIFRNSSNQPSVEVHSVRMATRINDKGWAVPDMVVEVTQRRRGYFDKNMQEDRDRDGVFGDRPRGDFVFRSGVTLLINPATMAIRRVIRSAGRVDDDAALERMRWYLTRGATPPNAFASPYAVANTHEPFALLHRSSGDSGAH